MWLVRTGPTGQLGVSKTIYPTGGVYEIVVDRLLGGTYAIVLGNKVLGHFTKRPWRASGRIIYYDSGSEEMWEQ